MIDRLASVCRFEYICDVMKYASDLLFHFVARGSRDDSATATAVCKEILANGLMFTPQPIQVSPVGFRPVFLSPMAVCFTDIPLRLSSAHVSRYGTCAIGVTKSWVKSLGGNPVQYFVDVTLPRGQDIPENLRGLYGENVTQILGCFAAPREELRRLDAKHWLNQLDDEGYEAAKRELVWALGSHLKPMFDLGPDVDSEDNEARRDRYYMEREWRIALADGHKTLASVSPKTIEQRNDKFFLKIPKQHLRVVMVHNRRLAGELARDLLNEGWTIDSLPTIVNYQDTLDL